jgi:hypothetical protein
MLTEVCPIVADADSQPCSPIQCRDVLIVDRRITLRRPLMDMPTAIQRTPHESGISIEMDIFCINHIFDTRFAGNTISLGSAAIPDILREKHTMIGYLLSIKQDQTGCSSLGPTRGTRTFLYDRSRHIEVIEFVSQKEVNIACANLRSPPSRERQ